MPFILCKRNVYCINPSGPYKFVIFIFGFLRSDIKKKVIECKVVFIQLG